jgi:hypothetical protein
MGIESANVGMKRFRKVDGRVVMLVVGSVEGTTCLPQSIGGAASDCGGIESVKNGSIVRVVRCAPASREQTSRNGSRQPGLMAANVECGVVVHDESTGLSGERTGERCRI